MRNGQARSFLHALGAQSLGLGRPPGTLLQSLRAAVAQSLEADPQQTDAHRIELGGYEYLFRYQDVRSELGPEIDTVIARAEGLRKAIPEVSSILLVYYSVKISHELKRGLDPGESIARADAVASTFLQSDSGYHFLSPEAYREAIVTAGIMVLKGSMQALNTGRDPGAYYPKIEHWLDELRKIPSSQNNLDLLQGRYFALRGQVLLKQGLSPLASLHAAQASLERLDSIKDGEITDAINHVYANLLHFQSLVPDRVDIDRHKISSHIEQIERSQSAWAWVAPWTLQLYISLANLELHEGQDPGATLHRLGSAIERCRQDGRCPAGDRFAGQAVLLRARWLMRATRPDVAAIDASLQAAQRHLDAAQQRDTPHAGIYLLAAALRRWQAEWALRQKRSIAVAIQEGLKLVARARTFDPTEQETLAIEGVLHLLAARATLEVEARRRAAQLALAQLEEALTKNPLLRHGYEPSRSEAARIAAGAFGRSNSNAPPGQPAKNQEGLNRHGAPR